MGTLYKDKKIKPSILDEYVKEAGAKASEVAAKKFVSDDDSLVLEDEGARVRLTGNGIAVDCFVTGVVLAVKGRVVANGEFEVDEICYPAPAPQATRPRATEEAAAGRHVLLCSGLRVGDDAASSALNLELMCDYVTGNLGGANDQGVAASIARVIICGGALPEADVPAQSLDGRAQAAVARPLRQLDVLLTTLAASVPVDLMPGDGDPTNQALPQQPLHPCLFPEAKRFSPQTFASCTNPHDFTVGGVDFLGTAGQNVSNLAAYSDVVEGVEGGAGDDDAGEALDLLEATVRWQHVAPSAPDTLACYPYKDRDPFFIERSPHVYFAGMQPAFGCRKVRVDDVETTCVAVPDFSKTGTVVLLNVDTLECHAVTFGR